jgi:PAP2 superfamily
MSATNILTSPKPLITLFAPAEWVLLGLVAALCFCCFASATLSGQTVDWASFFPAFGASVALVMIGAYIRATRNMPRLALGTIGFGVFMCFTASIAIFIFTLFPLVHPLIDPTLISVDAALGYSWPDFVVLVASYPVFGTALGYVYLSILPQMVGIIILLAFLNRPVDLHRFLMVGIICMIMTVAIWRVFPSVGPGAYTLPPAEVQAKIGLVVDTNYGALLRELAADGLSVITLDQIVGVIAFPSFHMVMACMAVWFTRRTLAFVPVLLVNIAMVPATLSHGGHHLVDLFAGLVTFSLCLWVVTRHIPDRKI